MDKRILEAWRNEHMLGYQATSVETGVAELETVRRHTHHS